MNQTEDTSKPLISVITICYNAKQSIEETILSVINQDSLCYEYIVVDGNSTDGTLDIIKTYSNSISKWISEPDTGIYNAMNKAVKIASGRYCLFMNAGDYMANNSVLKWVTPYLRDNAIYVGGCVTTKNGTLDDWYYSPQNPTLELFYSGSLQHQASFIPVELLREIPYDESLRMVSDWKFWISCIVLRNYSYFSIPVTICIFNMDGMTYKQKDIGRKERQIVLDELFPRRIIEDYEKNIQNKNDIEKFLKRIKDYVLRQFRKVSYILIKNSDKIY